jgi:hypothetical protein
MIIRDPIEDRSVSNKASIGRRRFIAWLGAAAAGIAAVGHLSSRTMGTTVIPIPHYIPEGYSLVGEYRGEPDGFRTGDSEIKLAYLNPKVTRKLIFGPLFVFVSPMTSNSLWWAESGTPAITPEQVTLRIAGAVTVEGQYYNGCWKPTPDGDRTLPNGTRGIWNTNSLNSLVFPFDGYMIGIVGSKQGGVGRTELIKMASSFGPVTN